MQAALWNIAWLLLGAAWLGPLPRWAEESFAAHMTLHMAIVAVVSPLMALGIAGRRFDPVRGVPWAFAPIVAAFAELAIVWAWHSPGLHHWARHTVVGLVCEQGMFLAAGLWVWLSAFGGQQPRDGRRAASGLIGLLLTSMHMTFLGALLAMSPRLLYAHHVGSTGSWSPLTDQHVGGAVMLVVGGIAYLAGGLWLARDLLAERRQSGQAHLMPTSDWRPSNAMEWGQ